MRCKTVIWLLLLPMVLGCDKPRTYEEGYNALQNKEYKKAISIFSELPNDSRATTILGLIYLHGDGVEKNYGKAAQLMERAARAGNSRAQFVLSGLYDKGVGVPKDLDKKIYWKTKSATQGNTLAMMSLGIEYEMRYSKNGDRDNLHIAERWYSRAYEYGEEDSLTFLVGIYSTDVDKSIENNVINYYIYSSVMNIIDPGEYSRYVLKRSEELLSALPPATRAKANSMAVIYLDQFGAKTPASDM